MSKVNLTLGENKTSVSLSLETKDVGLTWDQATWTWAESTSSWDSPKYSLSRESKSSVSLSLESK